VCTLPVTAGEAAGGVGAPAPPARPDPARPDLAEADLPVIADFRATIPFHTGRFGRNAFRPHLALPGLGARHFARWLAVLDATVDARPAGPAAEAMKAAGRRIAGVMQGRLGVAPGAQHPTAAEG
jgi:hemoglobin